MLPEDDDTIKIRTKFVKFKDLKEIVKNSRNKNDLAMAFGFSLTGGAASRTVKQIIEKYQLDTSHFYNTHIKYKKVERECPQCHKIFICADGGKESKTTCSCICSNLYFVESRKSKDRDKKISEALIDINSKRNPIQQAKCKQCDNIFDIKGKVKFCSRICANIFIRNDEQAKANHLKAVRDRVKRGEHPGWKVRSGATPSFPEKVTMEILEELQVSNITREHRAGRWYIDFADLDRKIALEIDGSQHDLPQQKASDEKKDEYLKQDGWAIFRIRWKKLTKESRASLKEEISKIFSCCKQN